jgi:ribonuclease Z
LSYFRLWRLFDELDPSGHTAIAGAIFHRIPSFGFVIQEPELPGTLDVRKATLAGLKPGPLFGQLKQGIPVVLENGDVVKPEDVLGPPIKGRKV